MIEYLRREAMRRRHIALTLLALGFSAFVVAEGRRAFATWLIHRGDFGRLEHLGPETYFIPAVRAYTRQRRTTPSDSIASWATRRLRDVIPAYEVSDIALHSSGVLVAALTKNEDERIRSDEGWQRLVALDPLHEFSIVADSGPLNFGGWCGLELWMTDLDRDGVDEIFFTVQGMGVQTGWFYHLLGRGFELIHSERGREGISSCNGFGIELLNGDENPSIQGSSSKWDTCPTCGKEGGGGNALIWQLHDGRIRRWRIRGNECGPACERPWAY
jgi:hypothetical protein